MSATIFASPAAKEGVSLIQLNNNEPYPVITLLGLVKPETGQYYPPDLHKRVAELKTPVHEAAQRLLGIAIHAVAKGYTL